METVTLRPKRTATHRCHIPPASMNIHHKWSANLMALEPSRKIGLGADRKTTGKRPVFPKRFWPATKAESVVYSRANGSIIGAPHTGSPLERCPSGLEPLQRDLQLVKRRAARNFGKPNHGILLFDVTIKSLRGSPSCRPPAIRRSWRENRSWPFHCGVPARASRCRQLESRCWRNSQTRTAHRWQS